MVINLGAYSTEIIRAGIEAVPKGHIEAGVSLAMTAWQVLRHVVLKQAFQKVYPALSSQIIIVMLGSAVVSQISARGPDLRRQLHPVAQLPRLRGLSASRRWLYLLLAIADALAAARPRPPHVPEGEVSHDAVQLLGHPVEPAAGAALDHRAVADRLRLRRHRRAGPAVRAHLARSPRWNGSPRSTSSSSRARRC